MDYRPRVEEASVELARESLIAISHCDPEKINHLGEPGNWSGKDQVHTPATKVDTVDELRSKLISIASVSSPEDPCTVKCNGGL